ncbi:hypothetical protein PC121_g15779 [Phytophthora cactorum]|nr:hypothetical protein PC120_g4123 [Phytophthora cactorum]KAG3055442.1 hypothetical protein PC121_g15779 [Phytophthora cactorum]KAG4049712.1 hypothetical protein PC123_g15021 [Phytophthora cactorum]
MRCQWLVLHVLASTALLVNTDAASKSTESAILPPDSLIVRSITTNRILKLKNDSDFDGNEKSKHGVEERGISTSTVETLTNSLKSPVSQKFDDWLTNGKSADDVFKLLTLDKVTDGLLATPHLNDWISYMKLVNKANPTKKTTLIATLTAHYGDEGLAKIIEAAKQVRATAALAKRVQTEQIQRWLLDGLSPEDVFKLLKLDEAAEGLFAQPQIVTWAKYLDDFNKVNPTSETTIFSFLKSRYKDEEIFVQMLIAAKNVLSTEKIAIRIQAEQTALWLKNKKEPAAIFKLLKLQDTELPLFENPLFIAWVKYTDDFCMTHFGTKLTTISVLREFYKDKDDVLAKMILAANKSPSTSFIAKRLFTEQMRNWYISTFTPEDVFKLLKLDDGNIPLLENPLFFSWARFNDYYRSLMPKEGGDLLAGLTKIYNDERELTTIFVKAWHVPETRERATQLLYAQIDRWVSANTDPVRVFYLLSVGEAGKKDVRKLLYDEYRITLAKSMKTRVRKNKP